jgi:hypothetical protein
VKKCFHCKRSIGGEEKQIFLTWMAEKHLNMKIDMRMKEEDFSPPLDVYHGKN